MNITLLGHTLKRPLTGIGRYTWELANELQNSSEDSVTVRVPDLPSYETDGLRIDPVPPPRTGIRLARGTQWELWRALRGPGLSSSDVVHAPGGLLSCAFAPRTRPPLVLTIHDLTPILMPEAHKRRTAAEFRLLARKAITKADVVVCDSHATLRDVRRLLGNPRASTVAHLGVSSAFQPSAIQVDAPYFLAVGTLEPRKNLPRLLRAFKAYRESGGKCNLLLTGRQGWATELEIPSAIRPHISFSGYVDNQRLAQLYSGANALVYPSLYEGFGLPPLEAMASGCPVLSSDSSSLPEVVGDAGLLVDPLDETAIAQAMSRLDDEGLRRDLRTRGLERARKFTWSATAKATRDAYLEAGR